jgi:hypothetical protein
VRLAADTCIDGISSSVSPQITEVASVLWGVDFLIMAAPPSLQAGASSLGRL